jgi:hypothetical protein
MEGSKESMTERRKTGKMAHDIFASTLAPTLPEPANLNRSASGRPPVHQEGWTKVTVVLLNRQIVFLDRLAADIRAKTGAAVKRAEIIRALVDTVSACGIDLTSAPSEADLRNLLAAKLGR